jgi:hypothetical protein
VLVVSLTVLELTAWDSFNDFGACSFAMAA